MLFSLVLKRMLLGLFLTAVGGVLPLLMAQSAKAQTSPVTQNIQIQAKVNPACKITGTQDINFGVYDPLGAHATAPLDAQGTVTVRCLRGTAASIKLGEGGYAEGGSSCTAPKRRMHHAGFYLPYGLYKNSSATAVWGCHADNDVDYTASSAAAQDFTIYGQIPAADDLGSSILDQLQPGTYTDTVQVIVSF